MENETPAKQQRVKWSNTKRRVVVYLLLLTFVVAGGASLIRGDRFRGWVADLSREQLEVILGEEVRVTSVEIHATDLSLELLGVEVQSENGLLFQAERLRADNSITGGPPAIEVVRPVGEIWIVDGRLRDFPGLGWAARDNSAGLPFSDLTIVDGDLEVVIVQDDVERRISLSGIDLATVELVGQLGFDEVIVNLPDREPTNLSQVDFGVLTMSDDSLSLSGLNFSSPYFQIDASIRTAGASGLLGELEVNVSPEILDQHTKETWTFDGAVTYRAEISGVLSAPVFDGVVTGDLEWTYGHKRVPKVFLFENMSGGLQISNHEGLKLSGVTGDYAGGELEVSGAVAMDLAVEALTLTFSQCEFDKAIGSMIGHPSPWVDFDGDANISLSGSLRPFELSGDVELEANNAVVWNSPERSSGAVMLSFPRLEASGSMLTRPGSLELDLGHVRSPNSDVHIRSLFTFSPSYATTAVYLSTDSLYLPDLAPMGGLSLEGYGSVRGSFTNATGADAVLEADVNFRDFGSLGYQFIDGVEAHMSATNYSPLTISEIRAQVGNSEYTGRLNYDFGSDEPLALDVSVLGGRVEDLLPHFSPVTGVEGELFMSMHLEGAPRALTGRFDATMSDLSLWGERYSVGEANGTMNQGEFSLEKLLIQREEGSSSIMARGRVTEGWALDGEILVDAMAIPQRIVPDGFLAGSIQVDAVLGGTLTAPEPNGRAYWRDAAIQGHSSGDGEVIFTTSEGLLNVDGALLGGDLELNGWLDLSGNREFRVEGVGTALPLELLISESINGEQISGEFAGGLTSHGSLIDGVADVSAYVDSGSLRWRDQSLSTQGRWVYKSDNNGSIIERVHLVGDGVDVSMSGSKNDGNWSVAGGGSLDLSWLPMVVPTVDVAHGNGEINFQSSPSLEVAIDINGGTIRADWFPHSLNDIFGEVVADASGVRLESLVGSIGGGAATISGGVQSSDWSPSLVGVTIGLSGNSIKLIESLPTLTGNGELVLAGRWPFGESEVTGGELLLSGDIELTDALFTERIDWEEWLLDFRQSIEFEQVAVNEEIGLIAFNIAVVGEGAGRVRNNIAEGVCDVDLVVVGDTANPGVRGVVRMHSGGSVVLQDREFEMVRGELRYIDPYSYDPELNLLMRTEIESRDETYRIEYHIDGPLSDWYSSAVSTPSLSQADINALLLFGLTRDDLERFGGVNSALLMEGADILLHGIGLDNRALDTIGGGVTLFDRVELVTGASERGSQVASETRVMLEKHLEAPYSTDMRFEFNPLRTAENTLELERELSDGIYVTIFRSSIEQDRSLDIGGAYGVDFKMRWDVE